MKDLKGPPDWPLMLSEVQAAAYTSLPDAAFRKVVDLGQLPESEDLAGHRRWNRQKIDRFRDRTPAALAGQPDLGPFADPLLVLLRHKRG